MKRRHKPEVVHGSCERVRDAGADPVVAPASAIGRPQAKSGTFPSRFASSIATTFAFSSVTAELATLAWPIAAATLGETAMGLVDTKLVGGLGAAALGGVGVAATLMHLFYSLTYGGMRGVKVQTAHAIGEGHPSRGFDYARAGILVGFAIGFVVLLACRDVTPLLRGMGMDAEIVPYARDFLAAVTLGGPATCALSALIQHRQGIGDSRTPMVIGIAGNVLNAGLAYALIYGHLGLPALGVRGAGYATATTEWLEMSFMLALFLRDERRAAPGGGRLAFGPAARGVIEIGLPTGLHFVVEGIAFTAFTAVLGSLGKEEIAAHQIALNVIRVSFLPGIAVADATTVLVGRALGRRRLDEADATTKSAIKLAVGFMAICGVGFALGGRVLASFFTANPLVIHTARNLLIVAAVFQVLDAINIVLRGALRGAKDVRIVAAIGIVATWTCLPASAWFLGRMAGLGALGGWLGFVGETMIAATLFWRRWNRGGWRKAYAPA